MEKRRGIHFHRTPVLAGSAREDPRRAEVGVSPSVQDTRSTYNRRENEQGRLAIQKWRKTMHYLTTFYDKKGTALLFREIDGILPIQLEQDMKIIIDDTEVKVSHWQYHFKPAEQQFELRIFLRGKWAGATPATLNVEPQIA
jgi:hypothetical protein